MCLDLTGKTVLLVGEGMQIADKARRLAEFGAELRCIGCLTAEDLTGDVAFVVVGDTPGSEAERISQICTACRIPLNVVDMPALCTFTFPAMVVEGDVTISVSTGGKAPGAAAYLAKRIREQLPERTGEILAWLQDMRQKLYIRYPKDIARTRLSGMTRRAFALGRPLTAPETEGLTACDRQETGNL